MYPDLNFVDPSDPNFPFLDASRRTVARSIWSRETVKDSLTADSNAELKVLTGPVSHKLLFGADYRALGERARSGFGTDPTPFDLYAPVYTGVTAPALSAEPDLRQSQLGLYAQDQMRLGSWLAVVGLRQDYVTNDVQGSALEKTSATTGRAALMYELPFGLTPYVTYAQSFNPIFGGGICATTCLAQRGEMVELGFKYNPMPGTGINGAIYDTIEKNRLAADPDNPLLSIQTGQVRIRGAELEVISRVTPDLDLIGRAWRAATMPASVSRPCWGIRPRCGRSTVSPRSACKASPSVAACATSASHGTAPIPSVRRITRCSTP